jgi:hypothetical protein
VSGVTVVVSVSGRHIVIMLPVGRFPVCVICYLVHPENSYVNAKVWFTPGLTPSSRALPSAGDADNMGIDSE